MTTVTSLNHSIKKPTEITEKTSLVVMLHGYGSNKEDLFSLAPALPSDLLIISAQAPITMSNKAFAWYNIYFDEAGIKRYNFTQAFEAIKLIGEFVTQMQEVYSISPEKTILLGFSQGSTLSIATSLTYPQKVQKVIGLSGFADQHILPKTLELEQLKNHDFFISHGTEDIVLPIQLGRNTQKYLDQSNIKHQYQEYPTGHSISSQNLLDLTKWIKERT